MKPSRTFLGAVALALLAACDIPTDVPTVDSRWILEAESTTIGVGDLLPSGVRISGSQFAVDVDPFSTMRSLGDMCATCASLNLQMAPKPSFASSFTVDASFSADVSGADLASASVEIAITNNFEFDPIRPPGGSTGSLTLTLTDAASGRQLGQTVVDGAVTAFGANQTLTRTMTLAPGQVGSSFVMTVELVSPAGGSAPTDLVPINTSDDFRVNATPSAVLVNSADVDVSNRNVTLDPVALDVGDMDAAIINRIQGGAIVLDIQNPFGVGVDAQLQITVGGQPVVTKAFSVSGQASSSTSVSLTGDDFRAFLGHNGVALTGTGSVSAAAGTITVRPDQQVLVDGKIDLTLQIG